jgi:hypothetical protein
MNVIGYELEDVICAAWNAERFEEGKEHLGESPELLSCLFFFLFSFVILGVTSVNLYCSSDGHVLQ